MKPNQLENKVETALKFGTSPQKHDSIFCTPSLVSIMSLRRRERHVGRNPLDGAGRLHSVLLDADEKRPRRPYWRKALRQLIIFCLSLMIFWVFYSSLPLARQSSLLDSIGRQFLSEMTWSIVRQERNAIAGLVVQIVPKATVLTDFKPMALPLLALPITTDDAEDFGALNINSLGTSDWVRSIAADEYEKYEAERGSWMDHMAQLQPNLPDKLLYNDDIVGKPTCRRNNWARVSHPTCNILHETRFDQSYEPTELFQEYKVKFAGDGAYRSVWIFERPAVSTFALKQFQLEEYELGVREHFQVQKEASILDALSDSPRIINIHAHCGVSLFIESAVGTLEAELASTNGTIELHELGQLQRLDVHPLNNLTLAEKLDLALAMAESLADIHGFEGGAIGHGDIHPSQWLQMANGGVKLNDFNSAEIYEYNVDEGVYCKTYHNFPGAFRSPEEVQHRPSNEKIDVVPLGNSIYVLVTGLFPYYELGDSEKEANRKVKQGVHPYVDTRYRNRSVVERELIDVMERCWEFDPDSRVSSFEVVSRLRNLKAMVAEKQI